MVKNRAMFFSFLDLSLLKNIKHNGRWLMNCLLLSKPAGGSVQNLIFKTLQMTGWKTLYSARAQDGQKEMESQAQLGQATCLAAA